jgi:hypothetical protein
MSGSQIPTEVSSDSADSLGSRERRTEQAKDIRSKASTKPLFNKPSWQRHSSGLTPTFEELELPGGERSFGTIFPPRSYLPNLLRPSIRLTTEEEEILEDLDAYGTPITFGYKKHRDDKMASSSKVPQDQPAPIDPATRTRWTQNMVTTGPSGHEGGMITYKMTQHYPLFVAPTSRRWWAQEDVASQFPDFVALDDVCLYAATKLFGAKERTHKFSVDFDQQGDVRSGRIPCGIPPKVLYKGQQYYLLYGKHYLLKGDNDVRIPSGVKMLTLKEGRKAARVDRSPFCFGAVKVPPKFQKERGVVFMHRESANWAEHETNAAAGKGTPEPSPMPRWHEIELENSRLDFYWNPDQPATGKPGPSKTPDRKIKSPKRGKQDKAGSGPNSPKTPAKTTKAGKATTEASDEEKEEPVSAVRKTRSRSKPSKGASQTSKSSSRKRKSADDVSKVSKLLSKKQRQMSENAAGEATIPPLQPALGKWFNNDADDRTPGDDWVAPLQAQRRNAAGPAPPHFGTRRISTLLSSTPPRADDLPSSQFNRPFASGAMPPPSRLIFSSGAQPSSSFGRLSPIYDAPVKPSKTPQTAREKKELRTAIQLARPWASEIELDIEAGPQSLTTTDVLLTEAKMTLRQGAMQMEDYRHDIQALRNARHAIDQQIRRRIATNPMRQARENVDERLVQVYHSFGRNLSSPVSQLLKTHYAEDYLTDSEAEEGQAPTPPPPSKASYRQALERDWLASGRAVPDSPTTSERIAAREKRQKANQLASQPAPEEPKVIEDTSASVSESESGADTVEKDLKGKEKASTVLIESEEEESSDGNSSSGVEEASPPKGKKAPIPMTSDSETDVAVVLPKIKKAAVPVTSDNQEEAGSSSKAGRRPAVSMASDDEQKTTPTPAPKKKPGRPRGSGKGKG